MIHNEFEKSAQTERWKKISELENKEDRETVKEMMKKKQDRIEEKKQEQKERWPEDYKEELRKLTLEHVKLELKPPNMPGQSRTQVEDRARKNIQLRYRGENQQLENELNRDIDVFLDQKLGRPRGQVQEHHGSNHPNIKARETSPKQPESEKRVNLLREAKAGILAHRDEQSRGQDIAQEPAKNKERDIDR